jgi:AcrR family transcriptional regulator
MNISVKPRRKPSQARARMTTGAIQDAFVLALMESGYERASMREIASIAGVGLGTLYLYFPNKDSIAAVTVHSWMRRHAQLMKSAMTERPDSTLRERADAMVRACAGELFSQPARWRALLILERRLTAPEVYQAVYRQHVQIVAEALAGACDWPARQDAHPVASFAFCISEAALRNALLVHDALPAMEPFTAAIQQAVRAAIDHALGPASNMMDVACGET